METWVNGDIVEIEDITGSIEFTETDYGNMVENLIRQKYTDGQEIAILRQKNTKPEEYEEWFNYCETCKIEAKKLCHKEAENGD